MNIIRPTHRSSGFTLVEIMIVVVIIGILASLGLPAFRQVRMASQNSRFYQDVRTFASGAEMYMLETGADPFTDNSFGDPNSASISAGMQEYIKLSDFTTASPLGGLYDFDTEYATGSGVDFFGVGVAGFTVDLDQIRKMDEDMDDGDLVEGKLIRPIDSRYYYVIDIDP